MTNIVKAFDIGVEALANATGLPAGPLSTSLLVALVLGLAWSFRAALTGTPSTSKFGEDLPAVVPYRFPFFGSVVEYGKQPIEFLCNQYAALGPIFTVILLGKRLTFCLGPDGNNFVFNAKTKDVSAEEAYYNLTVPVFGKEVVYDVPNSVLMEQKKFVKDALSVAAFRSYVPLIVAETTAYFESWGDSGSGDILKAMAELTIMTASRCLLGKEIRSLLDESVAGLYADLDGGFTPLNFLFPYMPIPSTYRRTVAQRKMSNLFRSIQQTRRAAGDMENQDVLQTLMDATYKDGSKMSESAVAHLLIALLMAGQHTSSTTAAWTLLYLAFNPEFQDLIAKERSEVLTTETDLDEKMSPDAPAAPTTGNPETLTYDGLKKSTVLDATVKETLRLRSPIHSILRKVIQPITYQGKTIPKGDYLCACTPVSQLDPTAFPDPTKWDPHRHLNKPQEEQGEWTINGVDIAEKSARSAYLPFGAGRHRCIGEAFAFLQLKTIIGTFVSMYEFELGKDPVTGKTNPFPERNFATMIVMPKRPTTVQYRRRKQPLAAPVAA